MQGTPVALRLSTDDAAQLASLNEQLTALDGLTTSELLTSCRKIASSLSRPEA